MSNLLYKLGRVAFGKPWYFIAAWGVIVATIVTVLLAAPPALSTDFRMDGTASQEVIDQLAQELPDAAGGQGLIAFQTDGSRIDEGKELDGLLDAVESILGQEHVLDMRDMIAEEMAKGPESILMQNAMAIAQAQGGNIAEGPGALAVDGQPVPGVMISEDGTVALFQFQFDIQTMELPAGTIEEITTQAEDAVAGLGIEVLPSQAMLTAPDMLGVGELIGVLIAVMVLIWALGSLVAAGLPLLTALIGLGVGVGGTFTLSHVFEIQSMSVVLALMLGLAVGIDYALFIVNRQRNLILHSGLTAREATGRALGTAGNAVVFAGATVMIALLALIVVRVEMLTTMAIVTSTTVAMAVLTALTLLPALLGLVGERICSDKARAKVTGTHNESKSPHPVAHAWSTWVTRNRWVTAIGVVLITGVVALPALDMQLGLPSGESYNSSTPERKSFEAIEQGFGTGFNGPLIVVASSTDGETVAPDKVAELYSSFTDLDGVEQVALGGSNDKGSTLIFTIIPETGPNDPATTELVTTIRDLSNASDDSSITVGVTGAAALGIDMSKKIGEVFPTYVLIVIILSMLLLLLVFRSIIVPLKATLGFLLTLFATFGATTALFQWGWLQGMLGLDSTTPMFSMLPIILVGVLYGLAMDYQVFLVSSMKEAYVHGNRGTASVISGFSSSSRVVVAAAIIMISVFAGFAFSVDPMIKQFGFALGVGILIDAFIVRMAFVPAVMAIFGDRAWWLPKWLDRILPNLDIEGDKLSKKMVESTE